MKDVQSTLDTGIINGVVSEGEAHSIRAFLSEIQSLRGMAETTAVSRTKDLMAVVKFVRKTGKNVELHTCNTEQALMTVAGIRSYGYSANTLRSMLTILKRYFLWRAEAGGPLDEKKMNLIIYNCALH